MVSIIYIIIIFCLLLFFLFTDINFDIMFHRKSEDDYIHINMGLLFGLIKIKFKIPYIDIFLNRRLKPGIKLKHKIDLKKKKDIKKSRSILSMDEIMNIYKKVKEQLSRFKDLMEYILSKIKIDNISIKMEIGIEDAALTAISVGVFYAIINNIILVLSKKSVPQNVYVKVVPNYSKAIFEIDSRCIIKIKIANIIIAGFKMIPMIFRYYFSKKGGENDERASYSRVNEDYNG